MSKLLEHILEEDYVSANKLFEERIGEIMESKLYEVKRSIDIAEVVTPVKGKPGQFKGQNTAKDWAKYRKQHPALGMHEIKPGVKASVDKHEKTASGGITQHGIEVRRKKGYLQAHPALKSLEFIKAVTRYHKTGKIDENTWIQQQLQKKSKEAVEAGKAAEQKRRAAGQAGQPYTTNKPASDVAAKMSQSGGRAPEVKVSASDRTSPDQKSRRERLAQQGIKMLKSKSAGAPLGKRYDDAIKSAKELEARGRKGAVSKVKWSKGGMKARAGRELSNYGSAMGSFAKGIIGGLGENTE